MTAAPTRQLPEAPAPPARRAPGRAGRRASVRVRRRRRIVALVVAGAVAVSGLATGLAPRLVSDGLGLLPSGGGGGGPEPATALLALGTDTPHPSIILLGHSGSARSVLLVPSAAQVEVPSLGSETLARALAVDGPEALGLSLSNALGVRVDEVVPLDAAATAKLLGAAGPLEVRFREDVRIGDKGWGEGTHRLSADDVQAVLAARLDDELSRLVTVHALVEAWLSALGDGALDAVPAPARKVVGRLAGEQVRFNLLPVEGLGLADERYQIDRERAAEATRGLFPGLLYDGGADGRVRVEIRNGTGKVGLARDVTSRVVPAGAEVVLTGNAARFSVTQTVLVLHDPGRREDAERLAEALGVGQLRLASDPVSVVDVSIVVGADYRPGGG